MVDQYYADPPSTDCADLLAEPLSLGCTYIDTQELWDWFQFNVCKLNGGSVEKYVTDGVKHETSACE